eukprot:TRINITY_DN6886_c0_g1_i1.p1 TRINITY_DN6886_c0_g1~~TRINITY_DN6886_c0_g1_i1.p1  ORF type:complete len:232 (+),score=13.39 TRINITY_DN6886_c0_g1_i1:25-696(+)
MATSVGPATQIAPTPGAQPQQNQFVLSPAAVLALRNDGVDINTVPILAMLEPQPQQKSIDDLAQCDCILFGSRLAGAGLLPGLIACLVIRTCAWDSWKGERDAFLRKRTVLVFTPTKIVFLYLQTFKTWLMPETWMARSATYQEIVGTVNLPVDTGCCCNDYASNQFHVNTNPPRQSGSLIDLRLHVKDIVEAHVQAGITYCQTCIQNSAPIDPNRQLGEGGL